MNYAAAVLDFLETYNGAVTAVATIFIAAFTIVLALVTGRQARLSREAIELARSEFNATHRPKIIVYGMDFGGASDGESPIPVTFRYVNSGDSRAEITHIGTKLVLLFKPTLPSEINFEHQEMRPPIDVESGMHGFRLTVDAFDPTNKLLLSAIGGSQKLICVGYIIYRDGNGTIRQTGFCREYDPASNRWRPVKDDEYEYAY
jgi:hypothetical protein